MSLFGADGFTVFDSMTIMAGEQGSGPEAMVREQLRARANDEWHRLSNLEGRPQRHTFFNKATLRNPSQFHQLWTEYYNI